VVKLELLKSLRYFIHLNRSIAMWNRTAVKSSVGSRRCNKAASSRKGEVMEFHHKLARVRLRDSIHGVARSREVRLLNELRGSHAASPLRWRGSFWGGFIPLNKLLVGSSLAQNLFL
jgi:hypothetical protein